MNSLPALIPLLPLLAFAVVILSGRRLGDRAWVVTVGANCLATALALVVAARVLFGGHAEPLAWSFEWLRVGEAALRMGVRVDPLGAMMLFMVTVVGTLISIYAVGYMAGDRCFSRFFAHIALFMAGMLGLVVADNLLLLFVSWEIMGLCSYFLIGFWFERPSAAAAGLKAFLTTRLGDVGLLFGLILLWWTAGTIHFADLAGVIPGLAADPAHTAALTAAALLIFVGTVGKSAQFPLHVWLPDAMEGPTPVSALIHAATMVAAGVFLVARTFMIFVHFPAAMTVVAWTGGFTSVFAALIALTQFDIKRVLAYSTLSQLGYMVMALGVGAFSAGMFHLLTHAFFKALLFLGAGSVITGLHHVQDLRQMGGLRTKMPRTHLTFLIATLAIAGVPGFSGFWSKDEILAGTFESGHLVLWAIGTFTAFLTGFYMFRLYFLAFTGRPRNPDVHAHESPAVMTWPLIILAVFAALIGLPGSPLMGFWVQHHIDPAPHAHEVNTAVMAVSTAAALAGILLAALMYGPAPRISPAQVAAAMGPLHRLSFHKFYIDEIYAWAVVRPTQRLARAAFAFDQAVIDGAGVNGTGLTVRAAAQVARLLTAGNLQWYAATFLIGAAGLALLALGALWP